MRARSESLSRLVAAVRALPSDGEAPPLRDPRLDAEITSAAVAPADLPALGRRLGAWLEALSRRLEPGLTEALARAARAWDQADALAFLDGELRLEADALRRAWRATDARAKLEGDPATRAVCLEGLLVLDAALGLVTLCERRLATLVRLRTRSPETELLPGGRPFLDLAAALEAAAGAWG